MCSDSYPLSPVQEGMLSHSLGAVSNLSSIEDGKIGKFFLFGKSEEDQDRIVLFDKNSGFAFGSGDFIALMIFVR